MEWKHKELIKASWDTIFKKGFKAWITVVAVVFIFTFSENALETGLS